MRKFIFLFASLFLSVTPLSFAKDFIVHSENGSASVAGSLPWAIQQAKTYNRNNPPEPHRILVDIVQQPYHSKEIYAITITDALPFDLSGLDGLQILGATDSVTGFPKTYIIGNNKIGIFDLGSARNCIIKGLGLVNFREYAILMRDSGTGHTIQNNIIGYFYHVGNQKHHTNKDFNRLDAAGIIVGSHHNKIFGNIISGVKHGIIVGGYPPSSSHQALMAGDNYISDNNIGPLVPIVGPPYENQPAETEVGILLRDGAGYNYIGNNTLTFLDSHAIQLSGFCFSNHVYGNYIGFAPFSQGPGNKGVGILVDDGALYNYIGSYGANQIGFNASGGISLGRQPFPFETADTVYPAYSNWVIYNHIKGAYGEHYAPSEQRYHQPFGVKIAKGSMDNVVQENTINAQYGNGIFLQEAYYNYVLRNILGNEKPNVAYGIYLMNSRYNWMIENSLYANELGSYGLNNSPDNAFY